VELSGTRVSAPLRNSIYCPVTCGGLSGVVTNADVASAIVFETEWMGICGAASSPWCLSGEHGVIVEQALEDGGTSVFRVHSHSQSNNVVQICSQNRVFGYQLLCTTCSRETPYSEFCYKLQADKYMTSYKSGQAKD
jgi:hypothetical protein